MASPRGRAGRTRDVTIGEVGLPIGVPADANLDIKATVWTLAGTHRISADASAPVDVLAGARFLAT